MTRLEKIKSKQAVIGIVGLGYVGLPLAQAFCQEGIKVVGFDIDQEKIDLIEKGQSYIKHIGDEVIGTMRAGGLFDVTSNFAKIAEVDVIIICVLMIIISIIIIISSYSISNHAISFI